MEVIISYVFTIKGENISLGDYTTFSKMNMQNAIDG